MAADPPTPYPDGPIGSAPDAPVVEQAVAWAERGFRLLRVHHVVDGDCSCWSGSPTRVDGVCQHPGKHPRDRAYNDHDAPLPTPEAVRAWFDAGLQSYGISPHPDLFVLDVDPQHGGDATLRDLEAEVELPETLQIRTGRGGLHLWFHAPKGSVKQTQNRRAGGEPDGIDVRTHAGQVVGPGSIHPVTGGAYALEVDVPIAAAPPGLLEWLQRRSRPERAAPPRAQAAAQDVVGQLWSGGSGGLGVAERKRAWALVAVRGACERIRAAPEGTRNQLTNDECYGIGGYIDDAGVSVDEIAAELEDAARDAEQPPAMVRRALEDGRSAPRSVQLDDRPPPQGVQAPNRGPATSPGLPAARAQIILSPRVSETESQTIAAIGQLPDVFVQGRALVRVVDREVVPMPSTTIVSYMDRAADYLAAVKPGEKVPPRAVRIGQTWFKPAAPPRPIADQVRDAGIYTGTRRLEGVTRSPVLRPDGSIVTRPGYDTETGLVYAPEGAVPPVPSAAGLDDAVAACAALLDVVREVPLQGASRSSWLAFVLTLACRSAIQGNVPFWLAVANQPRVGKTRSLQLGALIATGALAPPSRWPRDRDGEELGKRIDAAVLAGWPVVLFDNVRGPIGGEALELALTSTTYQPRILGKSSMPVVPQRTLFCASANNATLAGDMADRTLPIRLFWDGPSPSTRTFERPDLEGYVRAHRAELHAAALTIVSAYLRAGAPAQSFPAMGSYEAWGMLVRGALLWAGESDPCDAREDGGVHDRSGDLLDRLVAFIGAWARVDWTAGALARRMDQADLGANLGAGWTGADALDLARDLGVWDRANGVDSRKLGVLIGVWADRPAACGQRITRVLEGGKVKLDRRTRVPLYTLAVPAAPEAP